MFTHPRRVPGSAVASPEKGTSELEVWVKPGVLEYPALFIKAFHVVSLYLRSREQCVDDPRSSGQRAWCSAR
jgi:hypothetical protein